MHKTVIEQTVTICILPERPTLNDYRNKLFFDKSPTPFMSAVRNFCDSYNISSKYCKSHIACDTH